MSNTIDRKVVEMEFDNKNFEKNVNSTISALDRLKSSLRFDGADRAFDNLEKRSSKLDFANIGDALNSIGNKFSAFEQVAIGALRRIGEMAVDAGIKLVKSLSVDNLSAAWSKYEDKTKSVGTLIAQGYDISTVEEQLGRLNWFTDETSYSFTEMVSSIAKFTASGKDLPESVDALMGIANWAALSGQNAETASRAMYQLSQAMGSGIMRKEDYKSIQNVSMDTAEFRQIALDAGVALGTLKKNADGTYISLVKGAKKAQRFTINQFADHLTQDAWFTSDVMMAVYKQYASAVDDIMSYAEENDITASEAIAEIGDQLDVFGLKAFKASQEARSWQDTVESVKEAVASGFMQSYELLFGNYEDATKLWTDLANTLYDVFAQPVNDFNSQVLSPALKTKDLFIDDYISDLTGGSEEVIKTVTVAARKYGLFSDEVRDVTKSFTNQDSVIADTILHYINLNDEIGFSTDALIDYVSELTGASTADIARIKAVGDQYGYSSEQFLTRLNKVFGDGHKNYVELTRDILSVGDGIEAVDGQIVVQANDVEKYLQSTFNMTKDQIAELNRLSGEYGTSSKEVDKYLRSLKDLGNFGDGGLENTREAIKTLLTLTERNTKAVGDYKKGDIVGYITNLTGAAQGSVSALWDLLNTDKKLIKDEKEHAKSIDALVKEISGEDEELGKVIVSLMSVSAETDALTGRRQLLEAFFNVWNYIASVLEVIKEAFDEVFPPLTAERVYEFIERINKWSQELTIGEKADKLKRSFEGLFTIFKLIGQVVGAALIPIKDLFNRFKGADGDILDTTAAWGDWIVALEKSGKVAEKATEFFEGVSRVVQKVVDFIRDFIDISGTIESYNKAGGGLAGVFSVIGDKVKVVIDYLFQLVSAITGWDTDEVKTKVLDFFDRVKQGIADFMPTWDEMKEGFEKVSEFVSKIFDALGFGKEDADTGAIDETTTAIDKLASSAKTSAENLSGLGEKFSDFFDKFKGFFAGISEIYTKIKESGLLDGIGTIFKKIGQGLKTIKVSDLASIAEAGAGIFVGWEIGNFVKSVKQIPDAFSKIATSFSKNGIFGETISSSFKLSGIKKFAQSIALLAAAMFLISKIDPEKLKTAFLTVTILVGEMIGVMELMNHTMSKDSGASAASLVGFGAAILLLGTTLKKVADINPDRLWPAVAVVSILATVLAGAEALMSVGKTGGKLIGSLGTLVLVKSIQKLADTVIQLSDPKYSPDRIKLATEVVAGLTLALGVAIALINMGGGGSSIAGGIAALMIVASVVLLAKEVGKLAKFGSDVVPALGVVSAISGIITIMVLALSMVDEPGKLVASAASTVILAAAIDLVAIALTALAKQNVGQLFAAAGAIVVVTAALSGYVYAISKFPASKVLAASAALAIAGFAMLEMAVSLSLIGDAIHFFADFSADEFWYGVGLITAACGALGVGLALIGPGAIVMTVFATALLIAASAVVVFGIGIGTLAEGMIKMALAIDLLALSMKISGKDFLEGLYLILTGFADLIPLMARSIAGFGIGFLEALTDQLPRLETIIEKLAVSGIKVLCNTILTTVPMIADTVFELLINVLTKLVENAPEIIDKVLTFVIEVLTGVANHAQEFVEKVMDIIIAVINGLASRLPELIQAGANLLSSLFEGLINAFKDFSISNIDDLLSAVENLLGVMALLGAISALFPFAFAGVVSLGAIAVELATVLAVLGGLTKIPGLTKIIENGGGLLTAIGGALGGFIGGFAGNAMLEISSALPEIGANLSSFMSNASGFIEGASSVDKSVVDGALSMAGVLAAMSGASLISSITNFLTLGLGWTTLGDNLESIGLGLLRFANATKDIDADTFNKMTQAADNLIELSNRLPNTEGLWGWISGKQDVGEFGEKLASLATGMVAFGQAASGLSETTYKSMENAAKALIPVVELSHTLPNTEGLWGWLSGKQDLGEFGEKLVPLAKGMTDFAIAAMTLGPVSCQAMMYAAKALVPVVELSHMLPNTEGLWGWLSGKQDLGEFGEKLVPLAQGMTAFAMASMKLGSAAYTAMTNAAKALIPIVDISNKLPNTEGLWGWLSGKQDISEFGKQLPELAAGMVKFGQEASGLSNKKYDSMILASKALEPIIDMSTKLPNTEGIWGFLSGKQDIKEFGKQLPELAKGMVKLGDAASNLNDRSIDTMINVVEALDPIIDISNKLPNTKGLWGAINGQQDLSDFGKNLKKLGDGISDFARSLSGDIDSKRMSEMIPFIERMTSINLGSTDSKKILDFFKDLEGFADSVKNFSKTWAKADIDKINKAFDEIKKIVNVSSEMNKGITDLRKLYTSFSETGSYLITGFISGMNSKSSAASSAAYNIGRSVYNSLNRALVIASPSKLTIKSGRFFDLGLAQGISNFGYVAEDAAYDVGENAITGLNDSFSMASDMISEFASDDLVLRPVLDLTEIQNGSKKISSIIGGVNGYSLDGSMAFAAETGASMFGRKQENPGEKEEFENFVRDMVDKIGDKSPVTQNNTFNIRGDDPEEIAREVSQILTRELEREDDLWGQ